MNWVDLLGSILCSAFLYLLACRLFRSWMGDAPWWGMVACGLFSAGIRLAFY